MATKMEKKVDEDAQKNRHGAQKQICITEQLTIGPEPLPKADFPRARAQAKSLTVS